MNNNNSRNNNNNNRRRGRNNNSNRGGGGGGNQGNRIDSRARGNAPQMLEKYRKLAHDASLNDDRVMTEYYLQFADHYFRVMADMKAQRDEQQARQGGTPRRDYQSGYDDDGDEPRDYSGDGGDRDDGRNEPRNNPRNDDDRSVGQGYEGEADDGDNPFTPPAFEQREPREPREPRELREPREPRARKPARPRAERRPEPREDAFDGSLSADILPPAIARSDESEQDDDAPPARKPLRVRTRRPRTDEGDAEALEVAS